MGIARLACPTERDFTEKSVDWIEHCVVEFQESRPGNFVLGFTGFNGRVRRSRVADVMMSLANRPSIDWERVYVFLVDERYGFDKDEDCNASLIRDCLVKQLKRSRSPLPEDHVLVPDTSLAYEECAREYEARLCALLEREAHNGPHLVTIGLGIDQSVAGIFPEWYADKPERWDLLRQNRFGVVCTETQSFEVPRRITVNLRVLRKAEHVILYLQDGSDQAWKQVKGYFEEISTRRSERELKRARLASPAATTVQFTLQDGMLRVQPERPVEKAVEGEEGKALLPASPLQYILKYGNVTVVQLQVDLVNHHNFVVIGAAGDLASKKTFVSLFNLHMSRCLPTSLSVVAVDDPKYHPDIKNVDDLWEKRLRSHVESDKLALPQDLEEFRKRLSFMPASVVESEEASKSWTELNLHLRELTQGRSRDNRIFYLALPSFLFPTAVQHIRQECWSDSGFGRVIVEKPFGRNGEEARKLSGQLAKHLDEGQIYRIDHYLAKTLVMNTLALRFANREFGRLFHADNVANVRITFKEDVGVEGRAGYFDSYGIIRDIMQNHLLQVLTLVAMEAPATLQPEDVRNEKVKVLKQIRDINPADCVVGQYNGYQDDPDIKKINEKKGHPSRTPTFAVTVLYLDNERWSGVPFILKAGKCLENRHTIVRLQFKKAPPHSLFGDQPQNELVIRIQPNEAIYYKILAKMPGLNQGSRDVQQTVLDLDLKKRFEVERLPEAYEKLIHDVLRGEGHNFVRGDELEEAWRIFDPLLRRLEVEEKRVPERYTKGSRGPEKADFLIDKMGFRRYTVSGVPGFADEDFG